MHSNVLKRKQVLNNMASFFPVTFNARKYNPLSNIVFILRRGLTALKINRAQIRQNKKSSLPQMKHYAKEKPACFLVAVTLITIIQVKSHPTMAKKGNRVPWMR